MTPQDARARAACVCRTWRDAAADPALFATLRFDDGCAARLNDASLSQLCVRSGTALRELCLNAPVCRAVTAAGVIAALCAGGCAGVQRLVLPPNMNHYPSMSAEQAQELAAACPVLEHSACCVECESADDVAATCARLPGPLKLYIYDNHDAARAALQLPAQLAELAISICALDTACVAGLCEALRTNSTITSLSLFHADIGAAGAASFGEALRTNATLTSLDLGGNIIGDAGATALGEALRTNSTLTSLGLIHAGIGDAGAAALGEALRTNATLTALTLAWGNNIGDAGLAALTEALATNTTLKELWLIGRNMVGDGRG